MATFELRFALETEQGEDEVHELGNEFAQECRKHLIYGEKLVFYTAGDITDSATREGTEMRTLLDDT